MVSRSIATIYVATAIVYVVRQMCRCGIVHEHGAFPSRAQTAVSSAVLGVGLSSDGRLVASGGDDGPIRLWETESGGCLRALRGDRHYQRLDITAVTGVSQAQRAALLALGAIDG